MAGVNHGCVEDWHATKINDALPLPRLCRKSRATSPIASAHPFVGRDVAQVATIFQEANATLIEQAINISRGRIGFELLLDPGGLMRRL
jgi:hypothetical protein